MEFKASITISSRDFKGWKKEQIREYLIEMLDRMARKSDKNGHPLDAALLEDED